MNEIDKFLQNEEKLEKVAHILKIIGHPIRLKVIALLAKSEKLTVNDILEKCACKQSLLSQHLNNMKLNGVLTSEKQGKNVFYKIELKEVLQVMNCMSDSKL